jgi:hypothetical protein
VEHEQPARADKPPNLREDRTGNTIRKHVRSDVRHDRIEVSIGEGEPLSMSATTNLTIEPNLACACSIASPDRSIAVTE